MEINKYIDHTLLKADATSDEIKKFKALSSNFIDY
jgi:deoxyribose-phosphate aldolase